MVSRWLFSLVGCVALCTLLVFVNTNMDSLQSDEGHHRRLVAAGKTQPVFYNFRGLPLSPDGKKYVALTFDDGPHQHLTPRLLDILKAHKAKATFYVMGVKALIHPEEDEPP